MDIGGVAMLKPDFKITFGDIYSPIYEETELFFFKHSNLEKVALSIRRNVENILINQKRYFVQEIADRIKPVIVSSFLSDKEHLTLSMLNDVSFFKEYTGRKFTFRTEQDYLAAIQSELSEEKAFKNLTRLIDGNAIKIENFNAIDNILMDFVEESVKILSDVNDLKESNNLEFKLYYDLDNFLCHNGRMISSFPNYLKDCGVVDIFYNTMREQFFSIIIFVFKSQNTLCLR